MRFPHQFIDDIQALWRDISRYVTPRQMKFLHQFINDVQALVLMLIKDIVERYIKVCNSETDEISPPVYR